MRSHTTGDALFRERRGLQDRLVGSKKGLDAVTRNLLKTRPFLVRGAADSSWALACAVPVLFTLFTRPDLYFRLLRL